MRACGQILYLLLAAGGILSVTEEILYRSRLPSKCPTCGARAVVPVLYGLPTEEAFKQEQDGKIVIGGCEPGFVEWECVNCKQQFVLSKYRKEVES